MVCGAYKRKVRPARLRVQFAKHVGHRVCHAVADAGNICSAGKNRPTGSALSCVHNQCARVSSIAKAIASDGNLICDCPWLVTALSPAISEVVDQNIHVERRNAAASQAGRASALGDAQLQ